MKFPHEMRPDLQQRRKQAHGNGVGLVDGRLNDPVTNQYYSHYQEIPPEYNEWIEPLLDEIYDSTRANLMSRKKYIIL